MSINFAKAREILARAEAALLEVDVYDLLRACELPVPDHVFIPLDDLQNNWSLEQLSGEFVYLKLQADGILHKTEAGGVKRVARRVDDVRAAAEEMIQTGKVERNAVRGFLVVEAVATETSGVPLEMILGARVLRDFGPVIALGMGGVAAEYFNPRLKKNFGMRMASAENMSEARAAALVSSFSMRELWSGYRGTSRLLDDAELVRWVMTVSSLIAHFDGSEVDRSPAIVEAEINPLVISEGRLLPLDGLVRVSSEPRVTGESAPTDLLQTLLHPRTACIAGVSGKGMNPGRIILRNLLSGGFTADRLAILKPGGGTVDDVSCYQSIEQVPFDIDLLVLAVDAAATVEILESITGGVKSALLIAGGTSERSEGKELGERLARAVDEKGIAAVGPNCLGVISRPAGLDTLFIPQSKIPRGNHDPGGLAYISQSGAFMITRMNRLAGIEPRYAVSTGNQLRTGVSDLLRVIAEDPQVSTFAVYVEGFRDGDGLAFCRIAEELHRQGKRVILYKGGRTSAGADAASGHTASLATDYNVCRDLAENAGVLVAEGFEEFEDLVLISTCWSGKRAGRGRLVTVSNAGYECVGMADQLQSPLHLVKFDQETGDRIARALAKCRIDRLVDIHNPVDLTPMADADVWCSVAEVILSTGDTDIAVFSPVPPTPALQTLPPADDHKEDATAGDAFAARLAQVIRASDIPVACCVDCGSLYDIFAAELSRRAGAEIPVFRSADRMIRAINLWADA